MAAAVSFRLDPPLHLSYLGLPGLPILSVIPGGSIPGGGSSGSGSEAALKESLFSEHDPTARKALHRMTILRFKLTYRNPQPPATATLDSLINDMVERLGSVVEEQSQAYIREFKALYNDLGMLPPMRSSIPMTLNDHFYLEVLGVTSS